jgi:glutathione S-transferase
LLKLHFVKNTRAERIAWLLEELDLPYELNKLEFTQDSLKSGTHRKRHPLGRIPVLEDGDVRIFESGAITQYILARHKNGGLEPAVDSPVFPEYLQWFHFSEGMVMPPMNIIVVQKILLPPDRRDPVALAQAQKLLGKALIPLEEVLEGREYLVGDFTAADIMLGHAIYQAAQLMDQSSPNLQAYRKRIAARPAFAKILAMR